MKLMTTTSTMYEAVQTNTYGSVKLPECYHTKRDARTAIKESRESQLAQGYEPDDYYIVLVTCVRTIDTDSRNVISETVTRAMA